MALKISGIKIRHIICIKWQRRKRLLTILSHMQSVLSAEITNCWYKTQIINAMQRVRRRRDKPPNQLMLALRTRIKIPQTLRDGKLNALIIAQLKMQAIVLAKRAPITTV